MVGGVPLAEGRLKWGADGGLRCVGDRGRSRLQVFGNSLINHGVTALNSDTVVAAFQGEPGAMDTLLARLALLSRDIVGREDVYVRLADNIEALNTTLVDRGGDLQELIRGLDTVSGALADNDGQELALLIDRGGSSAATLAAMLEETDADLRSSVTAARHTTDGWIPNTPAFDAALAQAPVFAREVNATSQKGGFLSLYMCNFTVKWDAWETSLFGYQNSEACR